MTQVILTKFYRVTPSTESFVLKLKLNTKVKKVAKMASYNSVEYSDESNEYSEEEDSDMSEGEGSPGHHGRQRAEFTEMKEQMYQDKLADLKRQLAKLNDGTLPEWQKKLRKLDTAYRERMKFNEVVKDLEVEMVEQEFLREKKSAFREFEDQKVYLKDQLIAELEEKQKLIETERHNMELTGDSMELKVQPTRKLRRRANEPSG